MFETVMEILTKELALYRDLNALVKKQTDIIKEGDIQGLNEILKEQQKYITSITGLEEQRQQELSKVVPGKLPLPTISECIDMAPVEEKGRLKELYQELTALLQKIRVTNDLNQQLLEQSMAFVDFSLNLLRPQQEQLNYGPPQQKQQVRDTRSIFNKEV